MIKKLDIKNLRGISQCSIDDLGQINLFLGQNNCGKSTILESLFLLTGGTKPYNYQRINHLRRCPVRGGEDLLLNIYGLNKENTISIVGEVDGHQRDLSIRYDESTHQQIAVDGNLGGINDALPKDYVITFTLNAENGVAIVTKMLNQAETPDRINVQSADGENIVIPAFFISPAEPYENVENYYSQAIESKQEAVIESVVRRVDSSVIDLKFANGRIMVDVGFDKRIPVQLMGDGMKKVLSVVVNMAMVRNGVILIDEIDNGLHYTSMPILWKAIIEAARANNVQVFATTHNLDSLRALSDALSEQQYAAVRSDFRSYTIRKEASGVRKAVKATYPQFSHIINQEMELR